MKAILRNKEGFTRDYTVSPPPPPIIRMAGSGTAQIYDPHDLMDAEKMIMKEIRFEYKGKLKNPYDTEDALLYLEEGTTGKLTAADYNKFFSMSTTDLQKASAATAKEMIAKVNEAYAMTEKEAMQIAYDHKMLHGYDQETEDLMAKLGHSNPPMGMDPKPYLDYLLSLAQAYLPPSNHSKSGSYISPYGNPYENSYKNQLLEIHKQMQGSLQNSAAKYAAMKQQQALQQHVANWPQQSQDPSQLVATTSQDSSQWVAATGSYEYLHQYVTNAPNVAQGGAGQWVSGQWSSATTEETEVPPLVEKVAEKKEIPDPIEPKKRLMKKI